MDIEKTITKIILDFHPEAQAIYLFGTFGTAYQREGSDVDIALLLPESSTKIDLSPCADKLSCELRKDIDLINLREVSTVLCKEIIAAERLIYNAAPFETATFEMLTVSLYQKLNDERRGILEQFKLTKRAYAV